MFQLVYICLIVEYICPLLSLGGVKTVQLDTQQYTHIDHSIKPLSSCRWLTRGLL